MDRYLGRTIALTIVGILVAASLVGGGWWLGQRSTTNRSRADRRRPPPRRPSRPPPSHPSASRHRTPRRSPPPWPSCAARSAWRTGRRAVPLERRRSGQVDIRARIPETQCLHAPAPTVSLQRITNLWYVIGVSTGNLRVVSPGPRTPSARQCSSMATFGTQVDDRVRVRVTQDRYGTDVELGRADVTRRQESLYVDGQVAFQRPTTPPPARWCSPGVGAQRRGDLRHPWSGSALRPWHHRDSRRAHQRAPGQAGRLARAA